MSADELRNHPAVQRDGWAIRFVLNPSEELKRLAVQQNGLAIRYIHDPSEEVKRLAVQENGHAIRRIPDPSDELQRLAVQQDGYAIQYIQEPSEEVQRLAVQRHPLCLTDARFAVSDAVRAMALDVLQRNGRVVRKALRLHVRRRQWVKRGLDKWHVYTKTRAFQAWYCGEDGLGRRIDLHRAERTFRSIAARR